MGGGNRSVSWQHFDYINNFTNKTRNNFINQTEKNLDLEYFKSNLKNLSIISYPNDLNLTTNQSKSLTKKSLFSVIKETNDETLEKCSITKENTNSNSFELSFLIKNNKNSLESSNRENLKFSPNQKIYDYKTEQKSFENKKKFDIIKENITNTNLIEKKFTNNLRSFGEENKITINSDLMNNFFNEAQQNSEINEYTQEKNFTKNFNLLNFINFIEKENENKFYNPLKNLLNENNQNENILNNIPTDTLSFTSSINNPLNNINSLEFKKRTNERKFSVVDSFYVNDNSESTQGDFEKDIYTFDEYSNYSCDETKKNSTNNYMNINIINDPNSNFNYYSRQYIPKISKKSEKFKNQIPFLKEFNPKFLKKENIDKKILRKFRNFVKASIENDQKIPSNSKNKDSIKNKTPKKNENSPNKIKENLFLNKFIRKNLLPPMYYLDEENKISNEFRSFNTNYMLWLFNQEGIKEMYKSFTDKLGNEILNEFIESYDLEKVNKNKEIGIIQTLKDYIFTIDQIYTSNIKSANNEKIPNLKVFPKNENENIKKPSQIFKVPLTKCGSTICSEDIFDRCIDDLGIKNKSMNLLNWDANLLKNEEKNKLKPTKNYFNEDACNEELKFSTPIGKMNIDDQLYFENFNPCNNFNSYNNFSY